MGYKLKPNKSVAKRFRVTKTGKLKHKHGFTSHLMSARGPVRRRKLRGKTVLPEMHAKRMRKLMGVVRSPGKIATARAAKARLAAAAAEGAAGASAA